MNSHFTAVLCICHAFQVPLPPVTRGAPQGILGLLIRWRCLPQTMMLLESYRCDRNLQSVSGILLHVVLLLHLPSDFYSWSSFHLAFQMLRLISAVQSLQLELFRVCQGRRVMGETFHGISSAGFGLYCFARDWLHSHSCCCFDVIIVGVLLTNYHDCS